MLKHLIVILAFICFAGTALHADILDDLLADIDRIEMFFWSSLADPENGQALMVRTTFNKARERADKIQEVLKERNVASSYGNINTEVTSLRLQYLELGNSPVRYYKIELPRTSLLAYEKEFLRSQRRKAKSERGALSLDTIDLNEYEDWMHKAFSKYQSRRFTILPMYKRKQPDSERGREKQLERIQRDVAAYMEKIRLIRLIIVDIRQNIVTPAMKKQQEEKSAQNN